MHNRAPVAERRKDKKDRQKANREQARLERNRRKLTVVMLNFPNSETLSALADKTSLKDFCIATGVDVPLIARKFGRWSEFREAAGLPRHPKRKGWGAYTDQQIIDALKKLAAEQGERITLTEFVRHTRISNSAISNHFGNFGELRRQAGLKPNRRGTRLHTDEQLLQHFHNVATKLGRIPTGDEFNRLAPISMGTLYTRFGNKQQVERKYAKYLRKLKQE